MSTVNKVITLLSLALCAIPYSNATNAQEQSESERCISLIRLESTDVVDERNILFHMRDGTIYRNRLTHSCPGLRFDDTLMYRNTVGQLCDLDRVTILNDTGFGFTRGASCGLGEFYPITDDEAEALKEDEPA